MSELVIEAGHAERNYWRDLWRYRELFYFLAWRDVLVRYKQTALGVLWAWLQPLLTMIVFSIVFGRLAKLPSAGVPYPILVLAGLLPWQFVARAFSESAASLVTNTNLISKVYFPRLIVPLAAIVVGLVDFLISFAVLAGLMVWYGFWPSPRIGLLVVLLPAAVLTAIGPGLLFAALTVKYRDFRHLLPFVLQLGLYISPVGFRSDVVPGSWRLIYSLNPAVGLIDLFRWAILPGSNGLYIPGILASLAGTLVLLAAGFFYFRKTERTFADVI
jgi:lipopolysaccharide transport system permease protein